MKNTYNNIDEYIESFPKEVQDRMQQIRLIIRENAPEAIEAITWRMPTFKFNGSNLIHFAAFKKHIGIYPGAEAIIVFEKELSSYKTSKGAIQLPLDKPIPADLIKNIVKYRVEMLKK